MKGAKWITKMQSELSWVAGPWRKSAIFQHLSVVKQLAGRWCVCESVWVGGGGGHTFKQHPQCSECGEGKRGGTKPECI